jgi:hypothetical protein
VRFEVLTTTTMMSIVFWDVGPCSLAEAKRRLDEHTVSIFKVVVKAEVN